MNAGTASLGFGRGDGRGAVPSFVPERFDVTTLLLPLLATVAYLTTGPSGATGVLTLLWVVCFYGSMGGRPLARWRRRLRRLVRRRGVIGRA